MDHVSTTLSPCGGDVDGSQMFFTNVQLLGMDAGEMAAKHTIPFNKDMFKLPNKKGAEVVLYFLFDRLNPIMCKEEFRHCWPILDKKQEQLFRKTCNNWLTNIVQDDADAHLPRINSSMLMSPGGDRFVNLLFCFSRYVLVQVIKKENGVKVKDIVSYPSLTPKCSLIADTMAKLLQAATLQNQRKFQQHRDQNIYLHEQWNAYAGEVVKDYHRFTSSVREVERCIREQIQLMGGSAADRGSPLPKKRRSLVYNYDKDTEAVKRAQRVQKVRQLWKRVDGFYDGGAAEREVVDSLLDMSRTKHTIDSADSDVQIPGLLIRECEQEIQRRNVNQTYQGGKLNLISLLQLWNLSLHLYLEKLQQVGLPDFEDSVHAITRQVHQHQKQMQIAEEKRMQLTCDIVPELKTSVDRLQKSVSAHASTSPDLQSRENPLNFTSSAPNEAISLSPTKSTPQPTGIHQPGEQGQYQQQLAMQCRSPTKSTPQPTEIHQPGEQVSTLVGADKIINSVTAKRSKKSSKKLFLQPGSGRHQDQTAPGERHFNVKSDTRHRERNASAPSGQRMNTVSFTETPKSGKDMTRAKSGHTDHINRIKSKLPLAKAKQQQLSTPGGTTKSRRQNGRDMSSTGAATPVSSRRTDGLTDIPANTPTLKAHDILVDQLVEAVMDSHQPLDVGRYSSGEDRVPTPTDLNLNNPVSALDTEAFLSRDKLDRSPRYSKTSNQSIADVSLNNCSGAAREKINVYQSNSLSDVPSNHIQSKSDIRHADLIHVDEDYLLPKSSDVSKNQNIQQQDVRTLSFDDLSITSDHNMQSPLVPDQVYNLETSGRSNVYSPIFSPALGLNYVNKNESSSESVETPKDKILSPVIHDNTNNQNSTLSLESENHYNDFHSAQSANPFLSSSNNSSANSTLKGSSSNTTLQNDYLVNSSLIKTPSLVAVDDSFHTNTPTIHAKSQSTKLSSLDSLLAQVQTNTPTRHAKSQSTKLSSLDSLLAQVQTNTPTIHAKSQSTKLSSLDSLLAQVKFPLIEDLQSPLLLQSASPISIRKDNDIVSSVNHSFSGVVDENEVDLLTLSMKSDVFKDDVQDSDEDYEHLLKRRPIDSIGLEPSSDEEDGILKEFDSFSPKKFGLRVEGQSPWRKSVSSSSTRWANGINATKIDPNRINANELIAKYSMMKMNESETGSIPLAPSCEKTNISRSVTEDDGYLIPLKVSGPSEKISGVVSHQDPLQMALDDIFGEDDSILLPPSPVNDDLLI